MSEGGDQAQVVRAVRLAGHLLGATRDAAICARSKPRERRRDLLAEVHRDLNRDLPLLRVGP
jgi:hypothetical protein